MNSSQEDPESLFASFVDDILEANKQLFVKYEDHYVLFGSTKLKNQMEDNMMRLAKVVSDKEKNSKPDQALPKPSLILSSLRKQEINGSQNSIGNKENEPKPTIVKSSNVINGNSSRTRVRTVPRSVGSATEDEEEEEEPQPVVSKKKSKANADSEPAKKKAKLEGSSKRKIRRWTPEEEELLHLAIAKCGWDTHKVAKEMGFPSNRIKSKLSYLKSVGRAFPNEESDEEEYVKPQVTSNSVNLEDEDPDFEQVIYPTTTKSRKVSPEKNLLSAVLANIGR